MDNYHSFNFLKKIYFERTGGSKNELKAANLIINEVKYLGGDAYLEEFEVDDAVITKAELRFPDINIKIPCAGSGYSGNTPDNGVTGEFIYVTGEIHNTLVNYKDKIIFWQGKRCPHYIYEKAVEEGALGIILATGDVYKSKNEVDLDPYLNREPDYKLGKIPTVMVRLKDIERVLALCPKKASIILKGIEKKAVSHNVVAEIKGTLDSEEYIAFTAHYDSVKYSKGAYDNGTGAITLLELFNYFSINKPKRNLRFIWCGSEELGLLGSKYHTSRYEEDVRENCLLNVNIDMVAVTLGYDYCCVTGETTIVDAIREYRDKVKFPIKVTQGVYSSDSTPFADKGVPSMSFARLSNKGGAVIHSHDDVIERLSEPNYLETCKFIGDLTGKWINADQFPFDKSMPQNMLDALDTYLLRSPHITNG